MKERRNMDFQTIAGSIMQFLTDQNLVLKIVLILLELLFTLFALVLSRQISLLTNMLNQVSFTPIFKMISYAIVLASLTLLVITILV